MLWLGVGWAVWVMFGVPQFDMPLPVAQQHFCVFQGDTCLESGSTNDCPGFPPLLFSLSPQTSFALQRDLGPCDDTISNYLLSRWNSEGL